MNATAGPCELTRPRHAQVPEKQRREVIPMIKPMVNAGAIGRRNLLKLGLAASAAAGATVGGSRAAAASAGDQGRVGLPDEALVRQLPGFRNGYAMVNGVRLHYVIGGQGEPLILLPGWPATWWEFRKVMPALATRYRVIAVDLRGMGGSAKPSGGFDKKTMARDVRELAHHLGHERVYIAGHDIGSMVAFSFAANHPESAIKVAMLAVAHPDESLYSIPMLPRDGLFGYVWWFAFNQIRVLPEQLRAGRARYLTDWMLSDPGALVDPAAVSSLDRAVYARAYDYPDAIRASNGWYQAFGQDIADMGTYPVVQTPILAMYADAEPDSLLPGLAGKAAQVTPLEIKNAGHYFPEEQPTQVIAGLTSFFR